ncbi:hypothetical protein [Amycolatopsis sp. 195334CR]|uniref:hypothetical protein n=1 Tax=Amycolatopsis sp. 195334CR TaxID=2814588 RepID=UPI001A8F2D67|nr:hypothetical protein [Amycolatopsis sp. 195334CR]MBN6038536.1 hypothetical protein [Amycolatopsis sp. 195334CR]
MHEAKRKHDKIKKGKSTARRQESDRPTTSKSAEDSKDAITLGDAKNPTEDMVNLRGLFATYNGNLH